jgi:DNA replication protein DnaC
MGTIADGLRPILTHLETKHGPRATWPSPQAGASPRCARCLDRHWLLKPEPNPVASVPIYRAIVCPDCAGDPDEDATERLWRLSGIDPRERQRCSLASFDRTLNPAMRDAFVAAAAWGQGSGPPFLLLAGADRGIGKTHLAIAAAAETIARGIAVRYVVVARLLAALRATQRRDALNAIEDVRAAYEAYPAVVLDDLGQGAASEWAHEQLFDLVNERWRRERRTLVTSNVPADRLDPSTRSRLGDARLGRVVFCQGRDVRRLGVGG